MPALNDFTRELSLNHAKECESILATMLCRHYGSTAWKLSAQGALDLLRRDGLCLEKRIPPYPQPSEFVLYRGPQTKLGERLDESRIIDRARVPQIQFMPTEPSMSDFH